MSPYTYTTHALIAAAVKSMIVFRTHLLRPLVSRRNAGLYTGYGENDPISGLRTPGMKQALGPNMVYGIRKTAADKIKTKITRPRPRPPEVNKGTWRI